MNINRASGRLLLGFAVLPAMIFIGPLALAQQGAIPPCPEQPDHICMTFKPGDTVALSNDLAVTYEGADIATSFMAAQNANVHPQAPQGKTFVVVSVTVTNNSKRDIQVARSMFTVALPNDTISAGNPGATNYYGDCTNQYGSGYHDDDDETANNQCTLPSSPFPDPTGILPENGGGKVYAPAVMLHRGETVSGRLAFEVPANYNGALRLLCAFPDPNAQSIRYYVAWTI
jgi:hypothetical protein